MNKVAIIGPGLLGGSIGLALRQRGAGEVAIWARRPEAVEQALSGGYAHLASVDLEPVVQGADLIVLCTPIGSMSALAQRLIPLVSKRTLITDVGSVKGPVAAELGTIFAGRACFIGSHPMAGSEQTGMDAARANLFEGSVCILTPDLDVDPVALLALERFWQELGCRTRQMSALEHDQAVAMVSHFPHLLAAALVEMVAGRQPAALELCGPGFRDTTRVASGPPAMWTEILRENRPAVRKSAEAMVEKLREIITLLDSEFSDPLMHDFLTQAKAQRDRLRLPR